MKRLLLVAVTAALPFLVGCAVESEARVEVAGPPPDPPPTLPGAPSPSIAGDAIPGAGRPTGPADGVRDARRSRFTPRALPLLITEIQQLESLETATDAHSRDRPAIQRRIAEDYVELESAARLRRQPANASANARNATASGARRAAIQWYTKLADEDPNYAMIDEVRYFLGWEYEQAGDPANARRLYYEVMTKTPESKYAALAYFAFGEMFLQESEADPTKLDPTKAAYEKVLTFPPPANGAFGWARLRLGQVAEKRGDRAEALRDYRSASEFAKTFSQLPGSRGIDENVPPWVAQEPAAPWWAGAPEHGAP